MKIFLAGNVGSRANELRVFKLIKNRLVNYYDILTRSYVRIYLKGKK